MFADIAEFRAWYAQQSHNQKSRTERIALDALDRWTADPDTGNIVHRTGQFFSIQGLDVIRSGRAVEAWQQPIIVQPEQGILGILVKQFDGVPHCLLQLKMEPGNVNGLQLSPTVQATRSNFTGVHGGRAVPYLQYFTTPRVGRTLSDVLQSEQASWFLAKRNRNMIVQIDENVPLLPGFCWLDFEQIAMLLREPNLVNMDTRTVLAGAAGLRAPQSPPAGDSFGVALARSWTAGYALHTTVELLSWFTEAKGRCELTRRLIPLAGVHGWSHRDGALVHDGDQHFSVIGVMVEAPDREVTHWHQPMFEPRSQGVIAFLVRRLRGVPHLLLHARTETGALDGVEMAPTVQCQPDNYRSLSAEHAPAFLHHVLTAAPDRIRFDSVQSEEGGRFYHARNRYLLVEVEDDFPLDVPPDYAWVTPRQLTEFVRYGNHLNVEARSLLTFLGFYKEDNE
ncbi:NDP-hexose 2,3-dehydratase family protein [Streptomyces sp. ISL-10]|uniref:NDP-hexose 2,3-dehydratase family protein n=1 Tax=Streptomyces sp. ISL-10 TaxID=2819172 RepID=UPI001BEC46CC|nr:NDP-hexose 2,3-dehydratase family protein [Streptomyces sp. ISL-10]MBT2368643.1 NDP-hexose 2,3-dehydratase family protein [Streptomyces sp. ISL-10]